MLYVGLNKIIPISIIYLTIIQPKFKHLLSFTVFINDEHWMHIFNIDLPANDGISYLSNLRNSYDAYNA